MGIDLISRKEARELLYKRLYETALNNVGVCMDSIEEVYQDIADNRLDTWISEIPPSDEKTYEQGLKDAWECARKIEAPTKEGGVSGHELAQMFKEGAVLYKIFVNYSAREAITRIKEYEEEQGKAAEIKIGDEVTDDEGWKGVVTFINPDGKYLVVALQDGNAIRWKKESFKKTGRYFPQIAEVLKQMQEEE